MRKILKIAYIFKPTMPIATKFCTAIKTANYASSVVPNPKWRTADILKIEKWPCLHNGFTDQHKIWHGDAYWPSEQDMPY